MFTLISSALLALAPCLAAQSVTTQDLPDAVLAQVPADAALCYRIESLDALDAMLATLFSLYPERAGDAINVDMLLAQMPELDAAALDRKRPLLAYMTSLDFDGVAPIYAFIPTLDPAALIAALPTGAPLHTKQLADQYVAITNNQKGFPEVSTPSALPRLLNGSTFSAALELDGAMRQQVAFAIFVLTMTKSKMVGDLGLNEDLPTVMRDAMIDAGTLMFDQVIEFVGEVGQLTFSMDLADTVLDLDLGFLMKPDAVMGRQALPARTPVGSLAPAVDPKAMLSLVFNMDFGGWIAANKPMLEKGLMDFLGETKPLPEEVPLGWGGTEEFMDGVHEALVNGLDLLACLRNNVVLQTNSLEDLHSIKVLTTGTDLATLTAAAQLIASSDLLKVMGFSLQAEPRGDQQTRFSFGFDPAVFSKSFDMQSTSNQGILESIGAALSQPFEWSMTDQQGLVGVEFQRSRPQGPSRSRALDLAVAHIDGTPLLFLAHINYGKFFAENPTGLIVG